MQYGRTIGTPAPSRRLHTRRRPRRRRRLVRGLLRLMVLAVGAAGVFAAVFLVGRAADALFGPKTMLRLPVFLQDEDSLAARAQALGHTLEEYSDTLQALYEKEPAARDFVAAYPDKKGQVADTIDISDALAEGGIPLFMQWDDRWGYGEYGSDVMGLTGCGPTCLSMVAAGLTGDASLTPWAVAQFSVNNGYCVPGSGTAWALMDEGAAALGLQAESLPLSRDKVFAALEAGQPIICIMGPGDFTTQGHFIVLTGVKDGLLQVNDPNSTENSAKTWDYDAIESQIRGMWTYRRAAA